MNSKDRLIVALDVDTLEEAERLIEILSPEVEIFKVGISPFTGFGEGILERVNATGKKIFLDLKFHDIPNTVANAACRAAEKNIFMMNFHCLGGRSMLKAAVEGAGRTNTQKNKGPVLLGVTILTSMDEKEMERIGLSGGPGKNVIALARLAKEAGLDGVVASAQEARDIKSAIGKDFVVVTPGVRPDWAAKGDQKRVLSPAKAIEEGADYIVVGRPIIQAEDPALAARKIIQEIGQAA